MKKKYLAILIAACMVAMSVGCADEENATSSEGTEMVSEAVAGYEAQVKEEPAAEATVADTETDAREDQAWVFASADAFEAGTTVPESELENGIWEADLSAARKDQAGLPGDDGRVQAIIYEGTIEGGTILVTGVLTQRDPNVGYSAIAASDNTTHKFTIDANTVYQRYEDEPVPITQEECADYLDRLIEDSVCWIEIKMENGVVKTVTFYA